MAGSVEPGGVSNVTLQYWHGARARLQMQGRRKVFYSGGGGGGGGGEGGACCPVQPIQRAEGGGGGGAVRVHAAVN